MHNFNRRNFIKSLGAVAASGLLLPRDASAQTPSFPIEPGAKLLVLRWKRFVQGDEDLWELNTKKFSDKFGVPVELRNERWEEVRPKATLAAISDSGPDIIYGWFDDPHQHPGKMLDLSEIANYLGNKYGGWYDVARAYGTSDGQKWMGLPLGAVGIPLVFRSSHVKAAGFAQFPKDTDTFLALCRELKRRGTPAGFALGNAVGDGNCWSHWLLWAFGARLVDEKGNVVINSPETIKALQYAKELYATFVPGTLEWLDPENNKAFLAGQVSLTNNAVSIYYTAKNSKEPKLQEMAADIDHAAYPVGPIGRPTELHLFTQAMAFRYTKYPNAAKAYLTFMMEKEQYDPWLKASSAYVTQPLAAYESNPVWAMDPKHVPLRDVVKRMRYHGYAGPLGQASASAMADYIIVKMIADVAKGAVPLRAAKIAELRTRRFYPKT